MDQPDLTGYLCEQCLDAPAEAFVPAPWGGEMGVCAACGGLAAPRAGAGLGRGARLPRVRRSTRPGGGRDRLRAALHGQRAPAAAGALAGAAGDTDQPARYLTSPYSQNIRTRLSVGDYIPYQYPRFDLFSAPSSPIFSVKRAGKSWVAFL